MYVLYVCELRVVAADIYDGTLRLVFYVSEPRAA